MFFHGEEALTLKTVNVRRGAGGDTVGVLPQFARVVVTGGPVQAQGLTWWQIVHQGLSGHVAEMTSNYTILLYRYSLDNFLRSMAFVLSEEGGQNDADAENDPGGLTRWGIAQRFNPEVNVATLTVDRMHDIYRNKYWGISGAGNYEWPMCLCVFDAAVNNGVGAARKLLEQSVAPSGFNQARRHYYRGLSNFGDYGAVWLGRIDRLEAYAGLVNR